MASSTYVMAIAANLDTSRSSWALQLVMSVVFGAGSAFLWTTQNFYCDQCAATCGEASAGRAGVADAVSVMATRFNTSFERMHRLAPLAGNLVSSGVMLGFANMSWMRTLLFLILAAMTGAGCATFMMLPPMKSQEESEQVPSPIAVLHRLRSTVDVRYALLLFWIVANGTTLAFINADFTVDTVSPLLGPSYVGIIMSVFFATDSMMIHVWDKLVLKQILNRSSVCALATFCWWLFIVLKMAWTRAPNFEIVDGEWRKIPGEDIEVEDSALPVVLAILAACGDAFWTPGPRQILQRDLMAAESFSAKSNVLATIAAYKPLQFFGFAIQFVLGVVLLDRVEVRNAIFFCIIVFAFILFMLRDVFEQRFDRASTILTEPLRNKA